MSMIANYTPDAIRWEHIGFSGILEAGKVVEMPEGRAKHLLNKYSPRGIIQLEFGDDEEKRKKEAMETWEIFWNHTIQNFNQHNERMKNQNLPYIAPTKMDVAHAKMLNIELIGPWVMKPKENEGVKELKAEINDLKELVASFVKDLPPVPKEEKEPKDWQQVLVRAGAMNTGMFEKMITEPGFKDCPEEIKVGLRERYGKLKFTEPCPF